MEIGISGSTICATIRPFGTFPRNSRPGTRTGRKANLAINAIASLQDALGRSLHPVIIGGSQFVEYAATRFRDFTLIDAEPFVKTCHRRRFDLAAGKRPWRETWTLIDQGLDHNLQANICRLRGLDRETMHDSSAAIPPCSQGEPLPGTRACRFGP